MPCSAVTLSLATISGVVSAALLAIAVGTDNWQFIHVDRIAIEKKLGGQTSISAEAFREDGLYFPRTKGLFRTCYPNPDQLPDSDALFRSAFETQCENVEYYIFDQEGEVAELSDDEKIRLHMARGMVALFMLSFLLMVAAFFTGIAGCWRRSPCNVACTAILMLCACLLAAAAMGLWHGVEYFEEQRLNIAPYRRSWDQVLDDNVVASFDWSYYLGWVGTGVSALSFCLFMGASQCMQSEQRQEQTKQMQYMMPVYPQKAQYASYGYNYGYNYPPQYGHYNY